MTTRLLRTWIAPTLWAVLAMLFAAVASAQTVRYRIDDVPLPAFATGAEVNKMNDLGLVVGKFYGSPFFLGVGYIYDAPGVLGAPNTLHLLPDLMAAAVGPDPSEWTGSSVTGINNQGQVVGVLRKSVNGAEYSTGYVMDLSTTPWTWKYLPRPDNAIRVWPWRVNENLDVLAFFSGDGFDSAYLYNLADELNQFDILSDPSTGLPITLDGNALDLNNLGQVSGISNGAWFRLTPGVQLQFLDPALRKIWAINDFGVVCGNGARSTGRGKSALTACRCDTQIEYVLDCYLATGINNAGDLAIKKSFGGPYRPYLDHRDYGLLNIDNLLSPATSQADRNYWMAANVAAERINERDATGYPQMAGQASRTTTTGSGKNKVTTYENRIFILTPELAP